MKRCVFPHNNDAQALEKRSYARSVPCGAGDGVSAALPPSRGRGSAQGPVSSLKTPGEQGVNDILAAYVQVYLKKYASHFG